MKFAELNLDWFDGGDCGKQTANGCWNNLNSQFHELNWTSIHCRKWISVKFEFRNGIHDWLQPICVCLIILYQYLIVPIVIAMTLDEVLLGVKNQSNIDISCSHSMYDITVIIIHWRHLLINQTTNSQIQLNQLAQIDSVSFWIWINQCRQFRYVFQLLVGLIPLFPQLQFNLALLELLNLTSFNCRNWIQWN